MRQEEKALFANALERDVGDGLRLEGTIVKEGRSVRIPQHGRPNALRAKARDAQAAVAVDVYKRQV